MNIRRVTIAILMTLLTFGASWGSPLTDVYKRVQSSVVVLQTTQKDFDTAISGQMVTSQGLGSGVLISKDGLILTAAHVVQAADRIEVEMQNGERIPAQVLASEQAADLALVQLESKPKSAHVAPLGDSDKVEVGEQIFIVGAPLGISYSLSVGYISARRVTDDLFGGFLPTEQFQTDAAINTGNSGGPMFNMKGEVIGIVSYIISQSGGSEGLGFVITSNMARDLLLDDQAMWTGFQGRALHGGMARIFNLPQEAGILVEIVAERSLASKLGLQGGSTTAIIGGQEPMIVGGDILLAVLGIEVRTDARDEIRDAVRALKPGDELTVTVLRGGKVLDLALNFYPDLIRPKAPE
jgi:S1-C subfamily serine protease